MVQRLEKKETSKESSISRHTTFPFKKLICNLLLDVHPTCINKWSHPILLRPIHQFYLNQNTVYLEYAFKNNIYMSNISDLLEYSAINGNIIISKWCLKNVTNIYYKNYYIL